MAGTAPGPLSATRERLRRLEQLRAEGILTDEEYAAKRAAIVDDVIAVPAASAPQPVGGNILRLAGSGCPSCGRDVLSDRRFCQWCTAFLIQPSPGKMAGLFPRWVATWLDYLVPVALIIVSIAVTRNAGAVILVVVPYVVWSLWAFGRGMTVGKLLLGLRVMRTDGSHPGFFTMLLREWIGKPLDGLFFGVGWFWAIFDRDRQAWHDKIAGTVVVRIAANSAAGTTASALSAPSPSPAPEDVTIPPDAPDSPTDAVSAPDTEQECCPSCGVARERPADLNCRQCGQPWSTVAPSALTARRRWQGVLMILGVVAVALFLLSQVYASQSGTASQGSGANSAAPAGWVQLQGGGAEISLPPGYVGGDILTDADGTYSRIRDLGPVYSSWVDNFRETASTYSGMSPTLRWVLIAVDGSGSSPATFNVNRETVPDATTTISQVIDAETRGLPAVLSPGTDFKVVSRRNEVIAGLPSLRQVVNFTDTNGSTWPEVQYAVKDGAVVWVLTFSTFASTFDSQLPDFDRSAHTFVVGSP